TDGFRAESPQGIAPWALGFLRSVLALSGIEGYWCRERVIGGGLLVSVLFQRKKNCRVGKGRPAGSIELRVSPSPSKIPYGGFSPVRLQMDRQWRPSTT